MSFAPHTNNTVQSQLRAKPEGDTSPTDAPLVLGYFENRETGAHFEYAERRHPDDTFAPDFPQMIYVGGRDTLTPDTRLAKVLKGVAYVVVDEDAEGDPVVERWEIKAHRPYDTQWVRA